MGKGDIKAINNLKHLDSERQGTAVPPCRRAHPRETHGQARELLQLCGESGEEGRRINSARLTKLCENAMRVSAAQSRQPPCGPVDCSPPGSSVHGSLQAGTLEWGAISFSRGLSQPRGRTRISCVSCIGRRIFITAPQNSIASSSG